jgi:2-C-methyl-D-erythritol 2,4-cyclodiphosphate synthase
MRDAVRSEAPLKQARGSFRVGIGYDIHPLVAGRPLVLGGVRIEHGAGLAGHSDADALIHALCDALLGALNLGDLGAHFPETDEWKDAPSVRILGIVAGMVERAGWTLVNADCIVNAEEPRIAPHRAAMARTIAAALGADSSVISIKATRGEGLGPVGERRAIAAEAIVLLERIA